MDLRGVALRVMALGCCAAVGAAAGTGGPEAGWGPAEYWAFAERSNPGLQAAFARWQAAEARAAVAGALPDPRLTYARFLEQVETRVGPQRQRFALAQTFPWPGKRGLREAAAREGAGAARAAFEQARLDLFRRVQEAYADYWLLGRRLAIAREHVRRVGELAAVARARFRSGAAPQGAVIQAQVELGRLEDGLRSLESLRVPAAQRMNAALGRGAAAAPHPPAAPPGWGIPFRDEEVLSGLAESSPALRRLDHAERADRYAAELAGRASYPDVTLGVEYVDTEEARMAGVAGSGNDSMAAVVSVNLPVWPGALRAGREAARARAEAARGERADAESRLAADLALALHGLRDAERRIGLHERTLVPLARQALETVRQGFEAGTQPFASLVDAERMLLELERGLEEARAERGKREADVVALTGRGPGVPPGGGAGGGKGDGG